MKSVSNFLENKTFRKILFSLIGVFFILHFLATAINNVTNNTGHYKKFSKENNIKDYVGVSQDKLEEIYTKLIVYIDTGNVNFLNDFNEREKSHMEDVHNLYKIVKYLSGSIFSTMLLTYILFREKSLKKYQNLKYLSNSIIFIIIFLSIISLYIYLNFDKAFIQFHQIFFNNDLWILDPKTDIMIRMLPQEFSC